MADEVCVMQHLVEAPDMPVDQQGIWRLQDKREPSSNKLGNVIGGGSGERERIE